MKPMNIGELFGVAGKVALVTGGSRGIGKMIAHGYVANGARVYIASRKAEACDTAATELSSEGECIAVPCDLSTKTGRAALVATLTESEGKLDILVNNAGAAWGAPLEEYPEEGYDKVMAINVKALFMLTRDLIPLLETAAQPEDPSRVINIGSIDGLRVPRVENWAYPPSKAAVHHMSRVFADRLGQKNITVNAIAPGPFESQMSAWMIDTYRDQIESACPLGRIGLPSDMAGIAIYLASKAGAYVNGTVIPVDGGICIRAGSW